MDRKFDALIVITSSDYVRVRYNFTRLIELMPCNRLIFIGDAKVQELIAEEEWSDRAGFVNENDVLSFDQVHGAMMEALGVSELPRGITGWYYQQFLKMQYSALCDDEYYLVWDGDTIPTKSFDMFSTESGKPYFDMKYECHDEYFNTLKKLLGVGKVLKKSFISEHMLFSVDIMKRLISKIESNADIAGTTFYQKIINAVGPEKLRDNSFSEFETYGTFVAVTDPDAYVLKDWHSIRYGSTYFIPEELTEDDYLWLSKDFDAVSFEKNQELNEGLYMIFKDPEYRSKLTARQIVEAIQDSSDEGLNEEWEDAPVEADTSIGDEYLFYNYLGDSLASSNPNQAYLCYENAWFLCPDKDVKYTLEAKLSGFEAEHQIDVRPVSIIIVSYNCNYLMRNCIDSIRRTCSPKSTSVVVVDNASTDGVRDWLVKQSDITLKLMDDNIGFPAGCNEGVRNARARDDIFLLNNDTRLTHNALFWLRMGLYSTEDTAATGCVANYCSLQQTIPHTFAKVEDYLAYGQKNNVFMKHPYEEASHLCGFAMLIKRHLYDEAGGLDEALSPGYFEDADLGFTLRSMGYRLLVCHNSYIYHAGSQGFSSREGLDNLLIRNEEYECDKWGYDTVKYSYIRDMHLAQIDKITHSSDDSFRVLEVNCGCGSVLSRIAHIYPGASVFGIENNELVARAALKSANVICLDWKCQNIPFPKKYFDYIIYNDRIEEGLDNEQVHDRLTPYLKDDGIMIL